MEETARPGDPGDCEAVVTFLSTEEGGRQGPARSGYRPHHRVRDDYLTTGIHQYIDQEWVQPGESARAYITFITPEAYPRCLWIGRVLYVQEGSKVVASARIVRVFNAVLDRDG